MEDLEKKDQETARKELVKTIKRKNRVQRILSYFGFNIKTSNKKAVVVDTHEEVVPPALRDVAFDKVGETIQKKMDQYIAATTENYASVSDRETRCNELTYLVCNDTYVGLAMETTAAEVVACPTKNPIIYHSEDEKDNKDIDDWLRDIGVDTEILTETARDLFAYGEAFWGIEYDEDMIVGVHKLQILNIVERLEFSYIKAQSYFTEAGAAPSSYGFLGIGGSGNGTNKNTTDFQNFLDTYLDDKKETSFKSYLFGYKDAEGNLYYPWEVLHFRMNGNAEFWPYGRPSLIDCLGNFKGYQNSMARAQLAEDLNLPFMLYKVKTGTANASMAFNIVNEVKEEFENSGVNLSTQGMDGPALNTAIWLADDLLDIQTVERAKDNPSEGSMTIAEHYKNQIAIATAIPKAYLDMTTDGFQMSGVALATLFAPFRRRCNKYRDILLDGVTELIELKHALNGEKMDFSIALRLSQYEDLSSTQFKDYIDAMLEVIGKALGLPPEQLPLGIVKDVIRNYSPLSKEMLNAYADYLDSDSEDAKVIESPDEGAIGGDEGFNDGGDGFADDGDFGVPETGGDGGGGETAEESRKRNDNLKRLREAKLYEEYKDLDLKKVAREAELQVLDEDTFITKNSKGRIVRKERKVAEHIDFVYKLCKGTRKGSRNGKRRM